MTVEQYLQQNVYSNPVNYPAAPGAATASSSSSVAGSPSSVAHLNFFQHYFGTSLFAIVINVLLVTFVFVIVMKVCLSLVEYRRLLKQKTVCLELTPPAFSDKTPPATDQLFVVLHGLRLGRSFADRLLGRQLVLSLEVLSSKAKGIRFIARLPETQVSVFKQNVHAYLPDSRIKAVSDYLPPHTANMPLGLLDFKLARHFARPLKLQASFNQHDPIAYLTSTMAKLEAGELMALQLVLSPARSRSAIRLRDKLLSSKASAKQRPSLVVWLVMSVLRLLGTAFHWVVDVVGEIAVGDYAYKVRPLKLYPQSAVSPAAQELLDSINAKLAQPLYKTSLRALVIMTNQQRQTERFSGLQAALAAFQVPGSQAIVARSNLPRLKDGYRLWQFRNRLLGLLANTSSLLSSSELAALYHFPHSQSARTENVVKSLSRSLPAPLAVKSHAAKADFAVVLGRNEHQGTLTSIGLTAAERERHVYIVGGTGNGKTTMLVYAIMQDIRSGQGVAVIDPHGGLAEAVLSHMPLNRIDQVIYLNPVDISHPIGLNLLELPTGLSDNQRLVEQDFVTEAIISIFRKIFSEDDSGGHRIEYVLRNAIHTAFTVEGATLFTVYRLLTSVSFRKQVVARLKDEDLKNFWQGEINKAGDFQRVKMSAGITAKLGRFLRSEAARRILEQPASTINFSDIMDSGKVLICNLSKGTIGEDTSELLGISILAQLQLAALRRARQAESKRRPFYVYVDEFQNFATPSFVQMLSEARKYKLYLTMAEQSTAQQAKQRLVDIILANVGTVVCFRSASPADERLILPLFKPYIAAGEIAYLPSYNFYIRIAAVQAQEPLSGVTVLIDQPGSQKIAQQVIASSRKNYATKAVDRKAPAALEKITLNSLVPASDTKQPVVVSSELRSKAPLV